MATESGEGPGAGDPTFATLEPDATEEEGYWCACAMIDIYAFSL
jgi:hypothetical protein